ncbi:MAG: hypothetical protein JF888_01635 [Candidatus Dormibacteraeota bacterium]|uniref:Uncharacterized protein n=1 Tax=Candidatus Dormiibacter inghamiae TaxID=3127013 RepID=A0A934NCB3_9BACT|nr:hypothetical protein [Candidatus Dormibacteraeota bacterium]MBJ7607045.1 hypothetical protein [Candidatus Dormibacteraeota bacterium]
MNRSFLIREWGAVTFVVTVLIGLIVVPVALYFGNQSGAGSAPAPTPSVTVSTSASPSAAVSPAASVRPTASPTH